MGLTIKHGKFYDDKGTLVPIEHGNKDQIKLLERVKQLSTDGIVPHYNETKKCNLFFRCLCGTNVAHDFEIDDPEMIDEDIICHTCDQRYIVFYDDDQGYIVKLVKTPSLKQ